MKSNKTSVANKYGLPGESWLKYWRTKLPIRAVLVGRPKGRTIKAIRERAEALSDGKETDAHSEGVLLQNFHDDLEIARSWRGGKGVAAMTEAHIEKSIKLFCKYEVILPADALQGLLNRYARRAATARDWDVYMEMMMPLSNYAVKVFDLKSPKLCQLPRTEIWRLKCFQYQFLEREVVPILYQGAEGQVHLMKICSAVLASLNTCDPMMMTPCAAKFYDEILEGFQGLKIIMELPFSSVEKSSVLALANLGKGPLGILSDALANSPWHTARRDKWVASLPTIEEKEEQMQEHLEFLQNYKPSTSKEDIQAQMGTLTAIGDDLSAVLHKVDIEGVATFQVDFMTVATCMMTQIFSCIETCSALADAWWCAATKFMQAVSIVFPADTDKVPGWQLRLSELREEKYVLTKIEDLKEHLEVVVVEGKFDVAGGLKVAEACKACSGATLPPALQEKLSTAISSMVDQVLLIMEGSPSTKEFDTMKEMVHLTPAESYWRQVATILEAAWVMRSAHADIGNLFGEVPVDMTHYSKCLVDLQALLMKDNYWKNVPAEVIAKVKPVVIDLEKVAKEKHKTYILDQVERGKEELAAARAALAKVAYGIPDQAVAWSAAVKHSWKLEDIYILAENSGLIALDTDHIAAQLAAFKGAEKKLFDAVSHAGLVVEESAASKTLKIRAALTLAEIGMLKLYKIPEDTGDMQRKIQALVKSIRAEGALEKQLLAKNLFAWAFSVIKGDK